MTARRIVLAALAATMALSACGNRDDVRLRSDRRAGAGPDEFAIVPPRPLEIPADLRALPEPTPGGANRTDQTPLDDAVAALGGRPGAGGADAALVAAGTRLGVSPTVREDLAAEDAALRRRNRPRVLERLFGTDVYDRAYQRQAVRQYPELERWRSAGARTPSAPPDPATAPARR
ncbi:MAG: DUF3035 domain-containing protein [Gemmobacter sp.]